MGSFKNLLKNCKAKKKKKFRFTQKLPDMVHFKVCTKHGPRESGGATMGKTIYWINLSKIFS
jgi:hypothetical protein